MARRRQAPPGSQIALEGDLFWAARVGLAHAFKGPGDRDQQKNPTLAGIVAKLESSIWQRDRPGALIAVMRRAIDLLPDEPSDRPPNTSMTWREIGKTLYGFREVTVNPSEDHRTGYKRYYQAVRESTGPPLSRLDDNALKRLIVRPLRSELAAILLKMVDEVDRGGSEGTGANPPRSLTEIEYVAHGDDTAEDAAILISRDEYVAEVRSIVASGQMVVGIWGEAGTGKTVLAGQIAETHTNRMVLTLRMSNARLLQDDVVSALIAEGMQPTDWSESYCRAALRHVLGAEPRSGAVVIDNVSDEEEIWQLIPSAPKIPVLITTRLEPRSSGIAKIELRDFTDDQARDFVRGHLGDCKEAVLESFIQILGRRPLALGHAVLFVRESEDVDLPDLTNRLVANVPSGLSLVALPSQKARNLVRLYEEIVTSAMASDAAGEVLDCFLALSGRGAAFNRELLFEFMRNERGGGSDRVYFRSGLRTLGAYGLLREDSSRRPWLEMHPLTYEILRELRGIGALFRIEREYLYFLLSPDVEPADESNIGGRLAWTLKQEFTDGAGLLPGWKHFLCIDEFTMCAIREDVDEEGVTYEYAVRYETFPHGLYKFDLSTGERIPLEFEEARDLYKSSKGYNYNLDAKMLSRLPEEEKVPAIASIQPARMPGVLSFLPDEEAANTLSHASDEQIAQIFYYMIKYHSSELSRVRSLVPAERKTRLLPIVEQLFRSSEGTPQ